MSVSSFPPGPLKCKPGKVCESLYLFVCLRVACLRVWGTLKLPTRQKRKTSKSIFQQAVRAIVCERKLLHRRRCCCCCQHRRLQQKHSGSAERRNFNWTQSEIFNLHRNMLRQVHAFTHSDTSVFKQTATHTLDVVTSFLSPRVIWLQPTYRWKIFTSTNFLTVSVVSHFKWSIWFSFSEWTFSSHCDKSSSSCVCKRRTRHKCLFARDNDAQLESLGKLQLRFLIQFIQPKFNCGLRTQDWRVERGLWREKKGNSSRGGWNPKGQKK